MKTQVYYTKMHQDLGLICIALRTPGDRHVARVIREDTYQWAQQANDRAAYSAGYRPKLGSSNDGSVLLTIVLTGYQNQVSQFFQGWCRAAGRKTGREVLLEILY